MAFEGFRTEIKRPIIELPQNGLIRKIERPIIFFLNWARGHFKDQLNIIASTMPAKHY